MTDYKDPSGDSFEPIDPKELMPITDLGLFFIHLRKTSYEEFNIRFKKDGLQITLDPKIVDIYGDAAALEKIFDNERMEEFIKEVLEKDSYGHYEINNKLFFECINVVIKNLFYYVCNELTNAGILEMYFDKGEFCWRPTQKFRKEQLEKEVEVEMKKSSKRKNKK